MQEQIVGFEVAKLAKDKGFNWETINFYTLERYLTDAEGYQTERLESSNWNNGQGSYPTKPEDVECSAPTQSLLQKWLREKYDIHIQILPYNHKYLISILKYGQNGSNPNFDNEFDTYEEALEEGLLEAFKLIK